MWVQMDPCYYIDFWVVHMDPHCLAKMGIPRKEHLSEINFIPKCLGIGRFKDLELEADLELHADSEPEAFPKAGSV